MRERERERTKEKEREREPKREKREREIKRKGMDINISVDGLKLKEFNNFLSNSLTKDNFHIEEFSQNFGIFHYLLSEP